MATAVKPERMKAIVKKVWIEQRPDTSYGGPESEDFERFMIRAVAELHLTIPSAPKGSVLVQEVSSAGLFGFEANIERTEADTHAIAEVEVEQREQLGEVLAVFGLSHPDAPVPAYRHAVTILTGSAERRNWQVSELHTGGGIVVCAVERGPYAPDAPYAWVSDSEDDHRPFLVGVYLPADDGEAFSIKATTAENLRELVFEGLTRAEAEQERRADKS